MTEEGAAPELSATLSNVLSTLGDRVLGHHSYRGDDTILIRAEDRAEALRDLRDAEGLGLDFLMDTTDFANRLK